MRGIFSYSLTQPSASTLEYIDHSRNVANIDQLEIMGRSSLDGRPPYTHMYLTIRDDRVEQVRFQTFGCAFSIAACSVVTELVKGRTISDCLAVCPEKVIYCLGHVPEEKRYCLYNLKADSSVISTWDYQYDNTGSKLRVQESTGRLTTWTYDDAYQLVNENRSSTTGGFNISYIYDPVGNRLSHNAAGSLTTYIYDIANQIETTRDSTGVSTYTFDANGNQQIVLEPTGSRTTNTWDYENQLIHVELKMARELQWRTTRTSAGCARRVDHERSKLRLG